MEKGTQALPPTIPMGLPLGISAQIRPRRDPRHLTLVLQGHRQWALSNNLPDTDVVGAAAGRLLELIDFCAARELGKVSVHLFSDDLCRLPQGGNAELVRTFMRYITAGAQNMHRNDVQLKIQGSVTGLDRLTRGLLHDVAKRTQLNTGLQLTVVIDSPQLVGQTPNTGSGQPPKADLSNSTCAQQIELRVEPDLVIRTGGPLPVHRAMLWDTQKTALYFTDALWPNFDARCLREALDWYGERNRSVGIQLKTVDCTTLQQN